MARISIATYHSWAIDYAERVSVALRTQELWNQLREVEDASSKSRWARRRRLWRFRGRGDVVQDPSPATW